MSIDSLRQSLLASGVMNAELVSCVLGMWLFEYKFSKCIVFWSVVDSFIQGMFALCSVILLIHLFTLATFLQFLKICVC